MDINKRIEIIQRLKDAKNYADYIKHLGYTAGYTKKVTLSGGLSDFHERMDDLLKNFITRLELRKSLLK